MRTEILPQGTPARMEAWLPLAKTKWASHPAMTSRVKAEELGRVRDNHSGLQKLGDF